MPAADDDLHFQKGTTQSLDMHPSDSTSIGRRSFNCSSVYSFVYAQHQMHPCLCGNHHPSQVQVICFRFLRLRLVEFIDVFNLSFQTFNHILLMAYSMLQILKCLLPKLPLLYKLSKLLSLFFCIVQCMMRKWIVI